MKKKTTKTKLYRYLKDTIKSMQWHMHIEVVGDEYTLWEGHLRKSDYEIVKEKTKKLTKEQAVKFMEKNKDYLIEIR